MDSVKDLDWQGVYLFNSVLVLFRCGPLWGVCGCGDKYQKKRICLNPFVFFNRGSNISVSVRRWQTGLFIEVRVTYEKVIRINSCVQKSFGSYNNKDSYFDDK